MLRDGRFIKEQPPRIGAAYVKFQKITPSPDDVIFQTLILQKDTEKTIWKTLQKFLQLS